MSKECPSCLPKSIRQAPNGALRQEMRRDARIIVVIDEDRLAGA